MSVDYDASVVWGLFIPDSDELYGVDLTDVYELPPGFGYSMSGNFMDGEDIGYVIHPRGAATTILDSSTSGFGVYALDDLFRPTSEDSRALRRFAIRYGLPLNIGWFAISSVG